MKKMSPFDCDIRDIRYLNKTKYVVRVCSLFSVFGVFFCKFHHQLVLKSTFSLGSSPSPRRISWIYESVWCDLVMLKI